MDSYGVGELKFARGTDDERERELELEEELEQEVEVPTAKALGESDWDVGSVLVASVAQLPAAAGIGSLRSFVERHLSSPSLKKIAWSDKVYVTSNFVSSVCDPTNRIPQPLKHYVRLVDASVLFPKGGEVLLLSEREADFVVQAMWRSNDPHSGGPHGAVLFHQSLLRRARDGSVPGLLPDSLTQTANPVAPMNVAIVDSIGLHGRVVGRRVDVSATAGGRHFVRNNGTACVVKAGATSGSRQRRTRTFGRNAWSNSLLRVQ